MSQEGQITVGGVFGTILSLTLSQINVLLGISAALLTCIYVGYGIAIRRQKLKNLKAEQLHTSTKPVDEEEDSE